MHICGAEERGSPYVQMGIPAEADQELLIVVIEAYTVHHPLCNAARAAWALEI